MRLYPPAVPVYVAKDVHGPIAPFVEISTEAISPPASIKACKNFKVAEVIPSKLNTGVDI